jgi:hypothetical protein
VGRQPLIKIQRRVVKERVCKLVELLGRKPIDLLSCLCRDRSESLSHDAQYDLSIPRRSQLVMISIVFFLSVGFRRAISRSYRFISAAVSSRYESTKPPMSLVRAGSSLRLANSRRHSNFTLGLSSGDIFIFAISALARGFC